MCGISGYFSPDNFFDESDLHTMVAAQNHRGPDSNGTFFHNHVGLGHNRLSIIDLSDRGAQPMLSQDGRYIIAYNGEVYNYNEIATELKSNFPNTFQLRSSTDTEVILQAFVSYGPSFVEKLNGMFAISIYDKQEEVLYLFRDRIGIKPIYYFWDLKNFAFASEIKALKQLSKLQLRINYSVIPQYFSLGYIPAPYSIYENCYKLEAGHYLKLSKKEFEKKPFWKLENCIESQPIKNEKQAMVLLSDLISSSVQYQLKSDVPYGVFLSGGIDSSLVTANAAMVAGTTINTFSIGFENQTYNEAVYARKIANYLGTNHHEFTVTTKDVLDTLDHYMNAYGEPFADSSGIPTLLVSKMARQYVTVTLSGEGGDELFHGYGAYNWAARLANPIIYYNRYAISKLLKSTSSSRNKRAAEMFLLKNRQGIRSHIFSQEQYFFSASEIDNLLVKRYLSTPLLNDLLMYTDQTFQRFRFNTNPQRSFTPQELQALYDLQFYLPDNLLVKVDRASMHHSLETRVPFLDHRIVEQAVNISSQLKNHPTSKYILKEILYQYIPREYFNRPKQGFSIPLKYWLKNEMKFLITDYLNETVIRKAELVDYQAVKAIIDRFERGEDYLSQRLWLLINLHKWFLKNAI